VKIERTRNLHAYRTLYTSAISSPLPPSHGARKHKHSDIIPSRRAHRIGSACAPQNLLKPLLCVVLWSKKGNSQPRLTRNVQKVGSWQKLGMLGMWRARHCRAGGAITMKLMARCRDLMDEWRVGGRCRGLENAVTSCEESLCMSTTLLA
jgi:hypothetical protein